MAEGLVRLERRGAIAVVILDAPPVNAFSLAMRRELYDALQGARQDADVAAVVLIGGGKGFSAGGDIREFGTDSAAAAPGLSSHIHVAIERMGKPVIAVVHGFAMGGGLETVLACHYRIAEENAALALPEVKLGTLPLSATQRLPRLLGVLQASQVMAEGRRHTATEFKDAALFDQIVEPGQGLAAACALAADLIALPLAPEELERRLVRNHSVPGVDLEKELLDASRLLMRESSPATQALSKALEAAVRSECFDTGMDRARHLFDQLMAGDDIRSARDRFLSAPPGRSPQADSTDI